MTKIGRQLVLLVIVLSLFSCRKETDYYLSQGQIFHTTYHIKYQYQEPLGQQIQAVLDSFDLSLNPFNKESIISKVNNNQEVDADDWFIAVFNKAQEVSEASNGAFDITCAPFVNLWGFGFSRADSVTPAIIDSMKAYVGYRKVRLNGRKVIKDDPRILLNASAIAKGYSCDVVAQLLDSYGIENYMIEIGGEVRAKGKNPHDTCWRIEITQPDDDPSGLQKERQEIVQISDLSLATSGNYRNFYIKEGKKYAHTIDPTTGYPAEQNLLSATVIAKDCMTADAYATAFMTMGLEKACVLGDRIPDLAYYFVYSDENGNHRVKMSSNMESHLVRKED